MDSLVFWQTAAAVIIGNAFSAAFFFAIWQAQRLQKREGLKDDQLPIWIYPCGIAAPLFCVIVLLSVS
jgi:hypothetical protein